MTDAWQEWQAGRRQFVLAPGVYDGLTARVAGSVGFDAVYMTGFGTAASLGMPDVGLATLTEMAAIGQTATRRHSEIPCTCLSGGVFSGRPLSRK